MEYEEPLFNSCAVGGVHSFGDDYQICTLKSRTYEESEKCEDCVGYREAPSKRYPHGRDYWEPGDCQSYTRLVEYIQDEVIDSLQSVFFAATNQYQLKAGLALAEAGFTKYRVFKNPISGNTVTIWHYWKGRNPAPDMVKTAVRRKR